MFCYIFQNENLTTFSFYFIFFFLGWKKENSFKQKKNKKTWKVKKEKKKKKHEKRKTKKKNQELEYTMILIFFSFFNFLSWIQEIHQQLNKPPWFWPQTEHKGRKNVCATIYTGYETLTDKGYGRQVKFYKP